MDRSSTTFIDADDARLASLRFGDPAGRPVLLLHGGLGSIEDFAAISDQLAPFDCVAYDTRGHGASSLGSRALDYSLLAADAEAMIAATDLRRPIVIGFSDGGLAALRLAVRRNVDLAGVVVIGTDPAPPDDEVRSMLAGVTADFWRERFGDIVERYEAINPSPDLDGLVDAVRAMWIDAGADNYPGDAVSEIDLPTLCLVGDGDPLAPRAAVVGLADVIPNAALGVIPFAGHAAHAEHPEVVASFIRRFADSLDN